MILLRGLGINPQIGGKPDLGALFFLYFFSGAAGCSFKIFGSGFSI